LNRYLAEEFDYYDAFADTTPDALVPLDVFVAAGVNAFIGIASISQLRSIHRSMSARCDPLLAAIPVGARLQDSEELDRLVDLLIAANDVRGVLTAVATKFLHRKRPRLIPIIDSVMAKHYGSPIDVRHLAGTYVSAVNRSDSLRHVLEGIRTDLVGVNSELEQLEHLLHDTFPVGRLRIQEILIWTEKEERGYYR
jgi:hypothetical protein